MKIVIHGWTNVNCTSIIDFRSNLWLASVIIATFLPVATLVWLSFHGFAFPFKSQPNHQLCEVMKSSIDSVELLLNFFELSFVVDDSFSTRIVVSHQIDIKILALIPILVQQKVCFETKQKNTQEQIQRSQ